MIKMSSSNGVDIVSSAHARPAGSDCRAGRRRNVSIASRISQQLASVIRLAEHTNTAAAAASHNVRSADPPAGVTGAS